MSWSETQNQMIHELNETVFSRDPINKIFDPMSGVKDLKNIKCPTLVLCGRQDNLTPLSEHEEMAEAIPNANLIIIEDCGHLAPLERPYAVSAVMRYWLTL